MQKKPIESPEFSFKVPGVLGCLLVGDGLEVLGCFPAVLCRAAGGAQEPLEGGGQATVHRAGQAEAVVLGTGRMTVQEPWAASRLRWHPSLQVC